LWVKFRDAQVAALFPIPPGGHMEKGYGSMYPMEYYGFLTYLTKERVAQLRYIYLDSGFSNFYDSENF